MKKSIKRIAAMLFAVLLTVGAMPMGAFADDNTFMLYKDPSGTNEHQALVNGESRVVYCMQAKQPWPNFAEKEETTLVKRSIYSMATGENMLLLSDEQKNTIIKVLYAGYPYNGIGAFDEIFDAYKATFGEYYEDFGKPMADDVAASITAQIVWDYMSKWGIEGNYEWTGSMNYLDWDNPLTGETVSSKSIVDAVVDFAEGNHPIEPPAITTLNIGDSGKMTETDGVWRTSPVSIDSIEGYPLTFKLSADDGITFTDLQGNTITEVKGDEQFYVVTEDKDNITADTKITASAVFTYPTEFCQYYPENMKWATDPNSDDPNTYKWRAPQILLSSNVNSVPLSGSLNLSIKETEEKVGDLVVTKTVAGNAGDSDKEFDFSVILSDKSINGEFGEMTFKDGVAEFALKDGQSIKAEGLPEGVGYSVIEGIYTDEGYTTEKNNDEGTIVGDETIIAAFTNTRNAVGSLTISKKLEGNAVDPDQSFLFVINLQNQDINETFSGVEFTRGIGEVELKGGESKTIEGLPNGTSYTVTEPDTRGYICSAPQGISGIINEKAPATAEFTNTKNAYGNLVVSKTIKGNAASASDEFEFTVELSDKSINATFGEMTFENGVAKFKLRGGESKEATNLPNGVAYTVTEKDYSNDLYETKSEGTVGTIVGNETKTAAFTNTKNTYGDLVVTKTVAGNAGDSDKAFKFTVTLNDNTINGDFGQMTFENGVAKIELKDGQSAKAEGLPNGTKYKVVEEDYTEAGYFTEKDNDEGTIVGNDSVTAAFINTRNADGSLTISKELAGNDYDSDKTFKFTITLNDDSISGEFSGVKFENGVAEVELKGGESVTIEGLPNRTEFTVTEADYSEDGYECSDPNGISGKIDENQPAVAAFTNTRDTFGGIEVVKTVEGKNGDKKAAFEFKVILSDDSISGQYGDMNFVDGVASFTLKDGERKAATDLPNGIQYTVVEKDYSSIAYTTTSDNAEGIVVGDEVQEVSFINHRDKFYVDGYGWLDEEDFPNTGDQNPIALWLTMLLTSIAGAASVPFFRRRKQN